MGGHKRRPTVDELFELLKRSSLPTILVEGKDDIIFYRKIEEDLSYLNVDVLPAGNKGSVLELKKRFSGAEPKPNFVYVVDKDLWVHCFPEDMKRYSDLVTTDGYSIENDLFVDGDLECLLSNSEKYAFKQEIERFVAWYALAVDRTSRGVPSEFRTAPWKVLDDAAFFAEQTTLAPGETHPDELRKSILDDYRNLIRGKSLIGILNRQLSKSDRHVKFSRKQLMEFAGSRKGGKYKRLLDLISTALKNPR